MYLDLNYRVYLLRRLFFRRASQNVVSPGKRPDAPARVFLCAHYDAARTGAAFDPKRVARGARLAARLSLPVGPFRILFWSLAILLPILGARMAGIDSNLISLLQLLPTLVLLVGVFLLTDIELSDVVPGRQRQRLRRRDRALARRGARRRTRPRNLDVWVLLTGAEECLQEGMRSFVRAHRGDLDRETTYFVNVDTVGHGNVRFEAGAGWVVTYQLDRRLVELCNAIATADREDSNRYQARPLVHGLAGDSMPPRIAGFPATAITCLQRPELRPRVPHPRRHSRPRRPGRARPRPRLRAGAGAGARPRRRPAHARR